MGRRFACFFAGAYLLSLGITLVANAHLGTTPINSLPYVCSIVTPLSVGFYTLLINGVSFVGQRLLLGRAFSGRTALLQLPALVLFSLFMDANMWLTSFLVNDTYWLQTVMSLAGNVVTATGIMLCIVSNATILPVEGFLLALATAASVSFGRVKVLFDCGLLALAAIISVVCLHEVVGIREGTLVAAVLTGNLVRLMAGHCQWLTRLLDA